MNVLLAVILFIVYQYQKTLEANESVNFHPADVTYRLVRSYKLNNNSSFAKNAIKRGKTPQTKVGIVGAGISGLYAALILQDLDVNYEILEASNRIGGRYYTYHFDHRSKYNYVDLGAMRFPSVPDYDRLIGKQNWSLISYLNSKLNEKKKLQLIKYLSGHPNNVFHINGKTKFRSEVERNGDLFGFGKNEGGYIDRNYTVKNALFWEKRAFDYIQKQVNNNGLKYLLRNDYMTFREFLMDPSNREFAYPSDVVDWIESFVGRTGALSYSFMSTYLEESLLIQANEFFTIDGGVSKVIQAMNYLLRNKPKLKTVVKRINQKANNDLLITTNTGQFEYNYLIVTPLFKVLRDIDFDCDLHLKNRVALRTIPVMNVMKIGLQFKTRFWENAALMNGKPIFSGESVTDLRVRRVEYPSYGVNCSSCYGILLIYASFRDGDKFISFSSNEILDICLDDLWKLHGEIVKQQFTGKYKLMSWGKYKWTQGAFSHFEPGYFESYYPHLIQPDANGRIHFAGDTPGKYKTWSISSLTNAYRTVKHILTSEGLNEKVKQLESNWGTINEPDFTYF